MAEGAIKSDAGVQGLPCDGVYRQGKPCTPGVIFSINEGLFLTTWHKMRVAVFMAFMQRFHL
ncbi:MAG: hypothetical protein DM484_19275 [Candidatus Methylumidiphilus alinenensis]|uniref:Uncharacterized protein n=1 Tax=Candidatus Methylumidiphilus alinenensis TaxID=2202197 RepID=A0A2W4SR62_9GAMM|nr:MAG: hypothetical protein DM484_19275 [Candidatus Methylumidiphilus alinenensis]